MQATEHEIAVLASVYEERYGFPPDDARRLATFEAAEFERARPVWAWGELLGFDDQWML